MIPRPVKRVSEKGEPVRVSEGQAASDRALSAPGSQDLVVHQSSFQIYTFPMCSLPTGPVANSTARSKQFSLDFPPGLVDINSKKKASSQKWNAIKKLLFSRHN